MPSIALVALVAAIVFAGAAPALGQGSPDPFTVDPAAQPQPVTEPLDVSAQGSSQKSGTGVTPLFAPIPFKNTQVGWGLAVMGGVIHRFDADTTIKPSTGAVAGFYTENKSWGWMALEMARIRQDTWRLRGLVSHAEVNYDFFGIGEDAGQAGNSIPLAQTMNFVVASVLRRVTPGFYAGANAIWLQTSVELQEPPAAVPPPSDQDRARAELLAPGIQGELDTRDDDYWPVIGSLASVKASFFSEALGSSREFQRYLGSWSWYTALPHPSTLLATNVNIAAATGDAPFYVIPSIGGGAYGLRGYTQGRYRDKVVTTVQAEVRWHSKGSIGATVFGGFGQVAPSVGELPDAKVMPAGGVGLRYQLTRRYPMHMRADFAWGRDEPLLYFSVAEAF